jgi:hypothetical protein
MKEAPSSGRRRTAPLTAEELRYLWYAVPPLAVLLVAYLLFELVGGSYGHVLPTPRNWSWAPTLASKTPTPSPLTLAPC